MADLPLFTLDADARWCLAFDRQQWVLQRRAGKPCRRASDSAAMRRTGWRGVSPSLEVLRRLYDVSWPRLAWS